MNSFVPVPVPSIDLPGAGANKNAPLERGCGCFDDLKVYYFFFAYFASSILITFAPYMDGHSIIYPSIAVQCLTTFVSAVTIVAKSTAGSNDTGWTFFILLVSSCFGQVKKKLSRGSLKVGG